MNRKTRRELKRIQGYHWKKHQQSLHSKPVGYGYWILKCNECYRQITRKIHMTKCLCEICRRNSV